VQNDEKLVKEFHALILSGSRHGRY